MGLTVLSLVIGWTYQEIESSYHTLVGRND